MVNSSLRRALLIGFVLSSMVVVTGCAAKKKSDFKAPEPSSTEKLVDERIASAADQILQKLTLVSKLAQQDALVTSKVVAQPDPIDQTIHKPLPMVWRGPLEPAIQTIAKAIGWEFEVTGIKPLQPINVLIRSESDPAYVIIESCGWQAGKYVAVQVDEGKQRLRIVYLPERELQ